jgi:hypothetical protein
LELQVRAAGEYGRLLTGVATNDPLPALRATIGGTITVTSAAWSALIGSSRVPHATRLAKLVANDNDVVDRRRVA